MQINYSNEALISLTSLINFIESNNTLGAGLRWLDRFESFLKESLFKPTQIKLCHNITFKVLNVRFIYFNEWVIAFSVYPDFVLIEAWLHKSRIINDMTNQFSNY